jgi:hypothetical protein
LRHSVAEEQDMQKKKTLTEAAKRPIKAKMDQEPSVSDLEEMRRDLDALGGMFGLDGALGARNPERKQASGRKRKAKR